VPKKLVGRKVVEREEGGRVVGDTGKTERKRAAKMLRQAENDRIEKEQADRRRAEREQKEREKAAKDALAKGKGKGGKNK
jgi:molybdenum-dependent DNA-binding transcriptional regulator ModE